MVLPASLALCRPPIRCAQGECHGDREHELRGGRVARDLRERGHAGGDEHDHDPMGETAEAGPINVRLSVR